LVAGGIVTGSGFPVGNGYVVTNATRSGTGSHTIQKTDGSTMRASVSSSIRSETWLYSSCPDTRWRGSPLAAQRGTQGPVTVIRRMGERWFGVSGRLRPAQGRDIYNQNW